MEPCDKSCNISCRSKILSSWSFGLLNLTEVTSNQDSWFDVTSVNFNSQKEHKNKIFERQDIFQFVSQGSKYYKYVNQPWYRHFKSADIIKFIPKNSWLITRKNDRTSSKYFKPCFSLCPNSLAFRFLFLRIFQSRPRFFFETVQKGDLGTFGVDNGILHQSSTLQQSYP